MMMLRTENLVVGYEKKEVVRDINLKVKKGEVLCLLGANGSGKSTILRTLSGLLRPIKGEVLIQNKNLHRMSEGKLAKQLAVVLTNRISLGLLTVFEVVSMGRYGHTGFFGKLGSKDVKIVEEALELVNATNLVDRYFHQLSDGEKQKVFLARALVQEPELIIMDEPTSFLDIRHKVELISIIKTLSKERGITIISSLHEIALAVKCSDTLMLVKDGGILDYGCPEDILTLDRVKEVYDIEDCQYDDFLGPFKNDRKREDYNLLDICI